MTDPNVRERHQRPESLVEGELVSSARIETLILDGKTVFSTRSCEFCTTDFNMSLKTIHTYNGTSIALRRFMERVIEFPKLKTREEIVQLKRQFVTKKLFNIADWAPPRPVYFDIPIVDTWPFFAA